MKASVTPIDAGLTLSAVLADRGTLPAAEAVSLVQEIARRLANLHARGRIDGSITVSSVWVNAGESPALTMLEAGSTVYLDDPECSVLLPELDRLDPRELPTDIEAARQCLTAAGISLDPRQIDVCRLGALLCNIVTGESASAYIRSPRVKGSLPDNLRPALEGALGCDGAKRFTAIEQFVAALNADQGQRTALAASDSLSADSAEKSVEVKTSPNTGNGDTNTGFVSTAGMGTDTSVVIPPPSSPAPVASSVLKSESNIPFTRLGHYEIVAGLGRGGMGDVYRGFERNLNREVAIKVLPIELARNADFVRRFLSEANAVARLNHPNIVQIYFVGEENGHHFYAMQYVEGESLADLLVRRPRLSVEETLTIVEQVLDGLSAAHNLGMVHRDIKPGNILLDHHRQRALLADFGLVKSLESSNTGKTATGVIMGTADYLSPEQGRGQPVDCRSDLYSIGVMLYRMLSGRLPFEADSATALIFLHVYEPPPSLSKCVPPIPSQLIAIVNRLLLKSPADRHQDAQELLADLRAFRNGVPLTTSSPGQGPRRTEVIRLPKFDDDQFPLPAGFSDQVPAGWANQLRNWAKSKFFRHSPEILKQLQNTQQQVDGAVANYEYRLRSLLQLEQDAQSVLVELRQQATDQRGAADTAARQVDAVLDSTEKFQAQARQIASQHAAEDLERQAADQEEQLDSIRLRVSQLQAKVHELRNQRDILKARLKVAAMQFPVSGIAARRQRWLWFGATAASVAALVVFWAFIRSGPRYRDGIRDDSITTFSTPVQQKAGPGPGPFIPIPGKDIPSHGPEFVQTGNSVGMTFVLIPAGEFLMGASPSDKDAASNEMPQHRVRISKPFLLGRHEVTQFEWKAVMRTEPWTEQRFARQGNMYPATYISWKAANEFCRRLSMREGIDYRLPTEAEWELACRGGTATNFHFGDDPHQLGDFAWYDGNSWNVGEQFAHAVGKNQPNAFGLFDMHGNVWEWCSDFYSDRTYVGSQAALQIDPQGVPNGAFHTRRGGGFQHSAMHARSAYRRGLPPDDQYSDVGFRVVRARDGTLWDPAKGIHNMSGFNAATGYVSGESVAGRTNAERGWGGTTWWISDGGSSEMSPELGKAEPVSEVSPDGGLALHLTLGSFKETWAFRTWTTKLTGKFLIEQYIRLPEGGRFQSRPGRGGTPDEVAVHWKAENGFFHVMDGDGTGGGSFIDTGIPVKPLQWHKVVTRIDQESQVYKFFVDDHEFAHPRPLKFRGGNDPGFYIDRVDYLADSEAWLDGVRVSAGLGMDNPP